MTTNRIFYGEPGFPIGHYFDVPSTDNDVWSASLMKEDYVELNFITNGGIEDLMDENKQRVMIEAPQFSDIDKYPQAYYWLTIDFVTYEGFWVPKIGYYCRSIERTKDEATGGTKYKMRFEPPHMMWQDRIMHFFPKRTGEEPTFNNAWHLTDKPLNVLQQVAYNAHYINTNAEMYPPIEWSHALHKSPNAAGRSVSDIDEDLYQSFTFNGQTVLEALNMIAERYEAEWWVEYDPFTDGNYAKAVIYLGYCYDYTTDYKLIERGDLESVSITSYNEKKPPTRIYPFGSSRNLPAAYSNFDLKSVFYNQLWLNDGYRFDSNIPLKGYIDLEDAGITPVSGYSQVERLVSFPEIYPRWEMDIREIRDVKRNIEGGGTYTAYQIRGLMHSEGPFGEQFIFTPDMILPGQTLFVVFTSGQLSGMRFDVIYNPDNLSGYEEADSQWWEIVRNETYISPIPNFNMQPYTYDTFVLCGWDITKAENVLKTVKVATKELYDKAIEYLRNQYKDYDIYNIKVSEINTQYEAYQRYPLGRRVLLNITEVKDRDNVSRVQAFTLHPKIEYKNKYVIGDELLKGRLLNVEKEIQDLRILESTNFASTIINFGEYGTAARATILTINNIFNNQIGGFVSCTPYTGAIWFAVGSLKSGYGFYVDATALSFFNVDKIFGMQCSIEVSNRDSIFLLVTWVPETKRFFLYNVYDEKIGPLTGYVSYAFYYEGNTPSVWGEFMLMLVPDNSLAYKDVWGAGTYYAGEQVHLSVTMEPGYQFDGWYNEAGGLIDDFPVTRIQMPSANTRIFMRSHYTGKSKVTLTLLKDAGVSTVTGEGEYANDDQVTVSCTGVAQLGYRFDGWYDGVNRVSCSPIYTFFMPNDDLTLTARTLAILYNSEDLASINLSMGADMFTRNMIPLRANTYDVGSAEYYYRRIYARSIYTLNNVYVQDFPVVWKSSLTGDGNLITSEKITVEGELILDRASTAYITHQAGTGGDVVINLRRNGSTLIYNSGYINVTFSGSGDFITGISQSGLNFACSRGGITYSASGSGNVVTGVSASGSTVYVTYGALRSDGKLSAKQADAPAEIDHGQAIADLRAEVGDLSSKINALSKENADLRAMLEETIQKLNNKPTVKPTKRTKNGNKND
jgi:hypothetical protein